MINALIDEEDHPAHLDEEDREARTPGADAHHTDFDLAILCGRNFLVGKI